jgi:hypothetical protein
MSTYFNIEDSVYIDNSGNMGIGITNPSKKLEIDGDISFGASTISGDMIPDTDNAYDIGSADYKIRDMYVSDNSLWVGDSHKISISGGKMKFRKRISAVVPAAIIAASGLSEANAETAAIAHAGVDSLADMKLKHWKAYMRTLSNQSGATIQDIFRDNAADYVTEVGAENWLESGTKTYNTVGNVGIGTEDPSALLSLHYDPESSQGLKELMRLSWHDTNYDTLKGDGTKISFHTSDTNNFPGTVEAGYFGVMKANAVEANTEADITIANNDGTNMVERVRILSDGKVGIGDFSSSTPGYKLDVVGDINLTGDLRINGTAQSFSDTNTQLTQEQVEDYINGLIVAGSNITKTYDDASGTLTIASTDTDTNTQLTQEQVEDYINGLIVAGSNITKTYDDSAGTLTIASTASGGSSVWSTNSTVAYYNSGNVAIGTNATNNPLSICTGNASSRDVSSLLGDVIELRSASDHAYIQIETNTALKECGLAFLTQGTDAAIYYDEQYDYLGFSFDMSDRTTGTKMAIKPSGDVGIGTNDPNSKLHLYGNSGSVLAEVENVHAEGIAGFRAQGSGGNISMERFNASFTTSGAEIADGCLLSTGTGDSGGLGIRARASTGEIMFYTAGDNERMRIDASGNVKVDGGYLKVKQGAQTNLTAETFYEGLIFENTGTTHAFGIGYNVGGQFAINYFDGSSTYSNILTIKNDGKVGFGTTAPDNKLHLYHQSDNALLKLEIDKDNAGASMFFNSTRTSVGNVALINFQSVDTTTSCIKAEVTDLTNKYGDISFWTKNTDGLIKRMHIDEDGDIFLTGSLRRTESFETGCLVGGHGIINGSSGTNSSYYTNPIYTIGPSYMPNETTLENMYGIGYTHNNASFLPSGSNWGMYVTANGQVGSFLSGSTSSESFVMGKFGMGTNDPGYNCEINASNATLCIQDSRSTGNATLDGGYGSIQFRTSTNSGRPMAKIKCYATEANGHYNGGLKFYTYYQGSSNKVIDIRGSWVGIGLSDNSSGYPGARLHVKQIADDNGNDWGHTNRAGLLIERADNTNKWGIGINDGNDLSFVYNLAEKGYLKDSADVGNIDFTGQHRTQFSVNNDDIINNISNYIGLIVSSTGEYCSDKKINEAIPCIELANTNNDKKVFGVIADGEDPEATFRTYVLGAFGTKMGKPEDDNRVIINSLGEGCIWVCDVNGALENGDYMTTTELAPGYGVKQDDDLLHNYTVAKITENEDFSDMTNGKVLENGIKCKFVGCTYHCG